jgi:hypothetical protein
MKQPERPTLDESYAVVVANGDLGLPRGNESGAQGILAAAAWTEITMGTPLRRLRSEWDNARPRKKVARPITALRATGMTREQAKRQHNRELVSFAVAHHREKEALKRRIPEYAAVLEGLMAHAAFDGIEEPGPKALAVLDRWLDDEQRTPADMDEARLWTYLRDCLNRAKAALRMGVQGHTNHNPG